MQLAEAGKRDLDAPVQRYIPWFRVADPEASTLVTVRHLLKQTSGLTEGAGRAATLAARMQPLEPAVRALATIQLARPPGAAFEYSNLNYTTLGLVAETAAGQPFDAYLKTHIFGPLNMHHTYTAIEDARRSGLASGYRYWFGFPAAFDTPGHGGTVPAGGGPGRGSHPPARHRPAFPQRVPLHPDRPQPGRVLRSVWRQRQRRTLARACGPGPYLVSRAAAQTSRSRAAQIDRSRTRCATQITAVLGASR
jgi:CubicO group peptidase (beta-lactamase class C family)